MKNPYLPNVAVIKEIKEETPDIKTFRLTFQNEKPGGNFSYQPGQFVELSVFGVGEAPFCLASSPTRKGFIECSVKKIGKVTQAIHELEADDIVGIRGPYGNGFGLEEMKDKNLIFVGGGIGLAPLRSLIWTVLDNRRDFKDITIIYGARSVADLVYKDELEKWQKASGVKVVLTVDPGGENKKWKGKVGFVPSVLKETSPSPKNGVVITCGPPIMIKFVLAELSQLGFEDRNIITTLERKMSCGIGKCGRCNIGHLYVCKDGPVFSFAELKKLNFEL